MLRFCILTLLVFIYCPRSFANLDAQDDFPSENLAPPQVVAPTNPAPMIVYDFLMAVLESVAKGKDDQSIFDDRIDKVDEKLRPALEALRAASDALFVTTQIQGATATIMREGRGQSEALKEQLRARLLVELVRIALTDSDLRPEPRQFLSDALTTYLPAANTHRVFLNNGELAENSSSDELGKLIRSLRRAGLTMRPQLGCRDSLKYF